MSGSRKDFARMDPRHKATPPPPPPLKPRDPEAETLRDKFAMAAMPYALDCCCPQYDAAAKIAYTVADAMLAERVK